jgi:hypothetical protein
MSQAPSRPRLSPALLERIAVCALLLLALVPRVRDLAQPFDRGFEGYQGAFHAIAAANYEGLGMNATQGFPVLNIDIPESRQEWFMYTNHPPATPLLAWASLKLMGPPGWAETWSAGGTPVGIEAPMRLPFFVLHMLGLLALWYLARMAFGTQVALLSLALMASVPVSAMYGTLVNVETVSLPALLLATAAYGSFVRSAKKSALLAMGLLFALACSVTYAPLFFLPFLCLRSLWNRHLREAALVAVVGGLACLLPILSHAGLANAAQQSLGRDPLPLWSRGQELLAPLLSGATPIGTWIALQLQHTSYACGVVLLFIATAGLILSILRALFPSRDRSLARCEWPPASLPNVDLALPLLGGALAYFFAFYKHTSEEQWSFQLYLAPALVILAARALHSISLPLQKLRGGTAPLVLLAGSIMLPGLAHFENWRAQQRTPGPLDHVGQERGPSAPLPSTVGEQLALLLPPASVGFHPDALGLTPAAAWYAHRSLFAVSGPTDPIISLLLPTLGLQDSPAYFVLPKVPADAARTAVESLREQMGRPSQETETWSAWLLQP